MYKVCNPQITPSYAITIQSVGGMTGEMDFISGPNMVAAAGFSVSTFDMSIANAANLKVSKQVSGIMSGALHSQELLQHATFITIVLCNDV